MPGPKRKMSKIAKSVKKARKYRIRPGDSPGTISLAPGGPRSEVRAIGFGSDGFEEIRVGELSEIDELRKRWPSLWVHVVGVRDLQALTGLQEMFSLHNLAVEDVVNQNQRPKLENYDDHDYAVLFSVRGDVGTDGTDLTLSFQQVNIFAGKGFVLTIVELDDVWEEPVRRRIREGRARFKILGGSYLVYAVLDAVVDHYFPIMDNVAERLYALENAALYAPGQNEIARLHRIGGQLTSLRRALAPLKDILAGPHELTGQLLDEAVSIYFRDCHDHTAQLLDEIETDRELARSLVDTCLSSMSNRMNEIMKVLTVISTIFIPLSFIAGLYGMNFDPDVSPYNMPELRWAFGYPAVLGLMTLVGGGLLIYFLRKGWLR